MTGKLTETEARRVIENMRASKKEKAALLRHWLNGEMNARFAVATLAKQRG